MLLLSSLAPPIIVVTIVTRYHSNHTTPYQMMIMETPPAPPRSPAFPLKAGSLRVTPDRERVKQKHGPVVWGSAGDHSVKVDREEKEKQRKNARLMLHTWELVSKKEKLEKERKLKEKVNLQHQLISKYEKFISERKVADKQKNSKRTEEAAAKRKLLAKTIAEKAKPSLGSSKIKEKVFVKAKTPIIPIATPAKEEFGKLIDIEKTEENDVWTDAASEVDTGGYGQTSSPQDKRKKSISVCHHEEKDDLSFRKPENKIAKLIGLEHKEHIKMDEMWIGLKNHGEELSKPLTMHVKKLTKKSGPSTKECIEEYQKPIPVDYYTGKPILLNTILMKKRKINPPRNYYIVKHNKTVSGDKTNYGQRMVSKMRIASNVEEIEDNANWFATQLSSMDSPSIQSTPHHHPAIVSAPVNEHEINIPTAHLVPPENIQFLTDEGKIISSRKKGSRFPSVPTSSSSSKSAAATDRHHNTGSANTSRSSSSVSCSSNTSSSLWQPLSMSALNDYRRVKQRLVNGHGKFRHGNTQLWKPL